MYGDGVYTVRRALKAFASWLAQDLGRLYVGVFGGVVATVGLTLSSNRNTVANTAVVVGGVLVALGGLVPWFRRVRWKHGEVEMGIRSERVTEEDYREAAAEALDASPLRFELTEGHIVHIEKEERKARKRRIARQRRNAAR